MATVIKAGEAAELCDRLATIDLTDHLEEARRVVDAARREAERIVGDAMAQAERAYQETRKSGYDEGLRAGEQKGRENGFREAHAEATARFEREQADLVADMQRVVNDIDAIKEDLRIAARHDLLNYAVMIARKLTFAIGALHPEAASANLERAIELIGSQANLTVRANPRDLDALRTLRGGVMEGAAESGSVRLVGDETIEPGGCVVRSDRTEIDATLETQTSELVTLLLGNRRSEADEG